MQRNNEKHWTHLRDRSGENHDFIQLANTTHELVDARAFDYINVVVLTFNLNWNSKVSLMEDLHNVSQT